MKVKLEPGAVPPVRAHETDAGLDLFAMESQIVPANGSAVFRTGVHAEIPEGCAGILVSKSGLNVRENITSTGLIDQGYTGEIIVKLYNHGDQDVFICRREKISQLVVVPVRYEAVEVTDEISGGERGDAGFGSTGRGV